MNKILLVDDEKNILEAYSRNLIEYFDITSADSGATAIAMLKEKGPFRVIVSDYKMPNMNGVELLEKIREISPDTIQIMLTGQADMNAIINLINKGKIFRFLTKPCSTEDLLININDAIRQYELVSAERELLGKTLGGSIKVLTELLALTKPMAFEKTLRIRNIAKTIYSRINFNNQWQIELAAMLSQIGCIALPDSILSKVYRGFMLSENESDIFEKHPSVGADMIKAIPRMNTVARIIRYQEKNYNGSGVPSDQIAGEDIPTGARILKIAIDYDKLLSRGHNETSALSEMKKKLARYDRNFLQVFETIITGADEKSGDLTQVELTSDSLKEGMILAEDLITESGDILAGKNQQITQALKTLIQNYIQTNQIKDKITVISNE